MKSTIRFDFQSETRIGQIRLRLSKRIIALSIRIKWCHLLCLNLKGIFLVRVPRVTSIAQGNNPLLIEFTHTELRLVDLYFRLLHKNYETSRWMICKHFFLHPSRYLHIF